VARRNGFFAFNLFFPCNKRACLEIKEKDLYRFLPNTSALIKQTRTCAILEYQESLVKTALINNKGQPQLYGRVNLRHLPAAELLTFNKFLKIDKANFRSKSLQQKRIIQFFQPRRTDRRRKGGSSVGCGWR
jgi:hypothetical protein